jgi:hypothetical protein
MTRYRYLVAFVVASVAVAAVVVYAGQRRGGLTPVIASAVGTVPPPPPELTHSQVVNDLQRLQLLQAQMQILTYQFDQTKAALAAKLKALERDGYDLNVDSWTYVPKAKDKP